MKIGLDFDHTCTRDGRCFLEIIQTFQDHKHEVFIVSARRNTFENYRHIENFLKKHLLEEEKLENVGILLSYDEPKASYCKRQGVNIDIWIDNDVKGI